MDNRELLIEYDKWKSKQPFNPSWEREIHINTFLASLPTQGSESHVWGWQYEFSDTIKKKLIAWCRKNKYSQGDDYSVRLTKKGKWAVSYSNDYPLQHGAGEEFILTPEEFAEAMNS